MDDEDVNSLVGAVINHKPKYRSNSLFIYFLLPHDGTRLRVKGIIHKLILLGPCRKYPVVSTKPPCSVTSVNSAQTGNLLFISCNERQDRERRVEWVQTSCLHQGLRENKRQPPSVHKSTEEEALCTLSAFPV